MNKIPLKRFKHVGTVVNLYQHDTGNGNVKDVPIKLFNFIYANLHQTITYQLNNLGNSNNQNILIATYDPRFEPYLIPSKRNDIKINNILYRAANVSKDDSSLVTLYELTLQRISSNSVGEN